MTDLQCAATFVFAVPGEPDEGRALAESLRDRRVAAVYSNEQVAAARAAHAVADVLGVPVRQSPGLGDLDPEQEDDTAAVIRVSTALGEISDEHRGETVLVLGGAGALALTLPSLARNVPASYADGRPLTPGATAEMRVDGDGWVLDSWTGDDLR